MHSFDSQYQVQALRAVQTLLQGSGGVFSGIPESYSRHLSHEYSDGDISLLSRIHTFEYSELEDWQVDEVVRDLAKVNPEDWADLEDIESVNLDSIYFSEGKMGPPGPDADALDFAELTDLEYSDKMHRLLKHAIEHTYGQAPHWVGKGVDQPPCKDNNFCHENGKYVGKFGHDEKEFEFELSPSESGDWHVAYRLTSGAKKKLFSPASETKKKKSGGRK